LPRAAIFITKKLAKVFANMGKRIGREVGLIRNGSGESGDRFYETKCQRVLVTFETFLYARAKNAAVLDRPKSDKMTANLNESINLSRSLHT
jgi:hypothetical protein